MAPWAGASGVGDVVLGTLIDISYTRVIITQYIPPSIKLKMSAAAVLDLYFCAISG